MPKKFRDDTQMYLAGKEKKMLVQHGKEIYLIDISDMYKKHPTKEIITTIIFIMKDVTKN